MIVETMRPEEVVREACTDLPAMWNKMKKPIEELTHAARVNKKLRGKEVLKEYRSPQGNNWLVVLRPDTKVMQVSPFVWYRGRDGMYRTARIQDKGVSIHISHHALAQYFERFNREKDGMERLQEFILENFDMALVSHPDDPNELRCGIKHGMLTGRFVVPDVVAQLTTFINHGQYFDDQVSLGEQLDDMRADHAHTPRRPTPGSKKPWE
ncbi:MAG: hypothetical protein ABI599_03080 [Flavobacteriales bacterium]